MPDDLKTVSAPEDDPQAGTLVDDPTEDDDVEDDGLVWEACDDGTECGYEQVTVADDTYEHGDYSYLYACSCGGQPTRYVWAEDEECAAEYYCTSLGIRDAKDVSVGVAPEVPAGGVEVDWDDDDNPVLKDPKV